jgi:hypothetical protein
VEEADGQVEVVGGGQRKEGLMELVCVLSSLGALFI